MVLLAVVVLMGVGIGFLLTGRGKPLSAEDATRECARQVPRGNSQALGACIRSKQSPRSQPTSRAVVLVPLGFGIVGVTALVVAGRRRKGTALCPQCGGEIVPGDDRCVRCGARVLGARPVPAPEKGGR